MAFTDDSVKAKLSSLNETQDSIVSVAQWIMFHRRQAQRTAHLWMERIKESTPSKRLNLVYLANEVVQQSKMRSKHEFVSAYSPIIAEATSAAYKGSPSETQVKIRRVVEVWRQRAVFERSVQEATEKLLDEMDRTRHAGRKPALGGSLYASNSVPPELQTLVPLQTTLGRSVNDAKPLVTAANEEHDKLVKSAPLPPPVQAARLATVLHKLATAQGVVAECIKAREALITNLTDLIESNKTALLQEQARHASLVSRKDSFEERKRDVEETIMRGLSEADKANVAERSALAQSNSAQSGSSIKTEPERPQVEELTPPPGESFTPTGSPRSPDIVNAESKIEPEEAAATAAVTVPSDVAPVQIGSSGSLSATKKRKMSHREMDDEMAVFANQELANLDADVAGILGI